MEGSDSEGIRFWYIDDLENAVDGLQMLALAMSQPAPIKWWKWALIAAHQALYGFAIAALAGTSPLHNVVVQNRAAKIYKLRSLEGKSISEIAREVNVSVITVKRSLRNGLYVIDLRRALVLLQLDKDKHCLPWANSEPLKMTRVERKAIKRLIEEFRNNFEHYYPSSWTVEYDVLPEILIPTMRVIRYIALESNCISYSHDEQQHEVVEIIGLIETRLNEFGRSDVAPRH